MTRKELIGELAKSLNISQGKAKKFLQALTQVLAEELKQNNKVTIKNLGNFQTKIRAARRIKGPQQKKEYQIPERRRPVFSCSQNLKKKIRKKYIPNKGKSILIEKKTAPIEKFSPVKPMPAKTISIKPAPPKAMPPKPTPAKPIPIKKVAKPTPEPKPLPRPKPTPEPEPKRSFFGSLFGRKKPKPETKKVAKLIPQPEHRPIIRPEAKLKAKPAAKSPTKPIVKPAPKPAALKPTPPKSVPPKPAPPKQEVPALEAKIPEDIRAVRKDIITALKRPTSEKAKTPYVDLKQKKIPKEILAKIPEYIARLYQAIPVEEKKGKLVVAMVDPEDYQAIEFIKKKAGKEIKPVLATQDDIAHILEQYSGLETEIKKEIKGAEELGKKEKAEKAEEVKEEVAKAEAPTSRAVHSILKKAAMNGASDIHIEPTEKEVVVRYRIDGVLQKIITLPKSVSAAVIARIKILSNMRIDETRLPQDGRFELAFDNRRIDFRVSVFPIVFGEKAVMRILDKSKGILSLEELGVRGEAFDVLNESIKKTHGMVLVTGPTGSGKTTTLYAVLDKLNKVGVNIITLEDPVEYQIKGINQGQVKADIGFSFAKGLRSIVRQDPDVIMVGEIRDVETAEMAVHAALTGHVVLSTLHTNNAAGAVPRLIDMGIEPFLVTSSVNSVIAQRLTRKICEKCKEKIKVSDEVVKEVRQEIAKMPEKTKSQAEKKELAFYKGKGCDICNNLGYKGRVGIFEIFTVSDTIQELVLKKSSGATLEKQAIAEGMTTMKQDGILKVLDGITTIEEVWRVTRE